MLHRLFLFLLHVRKCSSVKDFSAWRYSTLHVYKLHTRTCVPRVISHCLTSQEPLSWFDTEVTLRYYLSIQQFQGAVRWKFNNDLPQGYRMDRVGFTWSIFHFICINDDILSNTRTISKKRCPLNELNAFRGQFLYKDISKPLWPFKLIRYSELIFVFCIFNALSNFERSDNELEARYIV